MCNSFKNGGNTVEINASTTSADISLPGAGNVIQIINEGSDVIFIRTGNGSQIATASDFPVQKGATAFLSIDFSDDNVAAILRFGTGSALITRGSS